MIIASVKKEPLASRAVSMPPSVCLHGIGEFLKSSRVFPSSRKAVCSAERETIKWVSALLCEMDFFSSSRQP